jgi:group I intron endonuclease
MSEKVFSIYKVTNLINKKVYVGYTEKTINERFKKHLQEAYNKSNNRVFLNAIRKYRKENFVVELCEQFSDINEAFKAETFYIKKYISHYLDGHGYNMSYGGQGNPAGNTTPRKLNDTHPFKNDINLKRISEGTHNFGSSFSKKYNAERIDSGTHNFITNNPSKGKVVCRDKAGNVVLVPSDIYKSQTGPAENWEYAANGSKEAKRRKQLLA